MCSRKMRRRGAVTVFTVFILMALIAFVGLAIDYGYVFLTALQLQSAADGAALAGVQQIWTSHDAARGAAIDTAAANFAGGVSVGIIDNPQNAADGDVVCGIYDRSTHTFTPDTTTDANAVRVVARRNDGSASGPLGLLFGPIFGRQTANVARYAIAMAEGGPAFADIIALNRHDPLSFYLHGDVYLNVGNGDGTVQVDSDNTTNNQGASLVQGTSVQFLAGEVNVVGMQFERGKPNIPETNEFQPYQPDPYADLPSPTVPGSATYPSKPKITGSGVFQPGFYPGGIDLKAGNNVTLQPGVYILNTGFFINGHATMTGYGVMFYLNQGTVHDNGTGQVYVTPPTEGVYEGVQFFQARNNTEKASFNGGTIWDGAQVDDTSTPDVNESEIGAGTFYFPVAKTEFGGTGNMWFNGLVADKIEVYGTGDVYVTGGYESAEGVSKIYLIE